MSDTIAAIATPQLPSAIGILRLSGPGTLTALERVFRAGNGRLAGEQAPRRMVYGDLLDESGSVIDHVLCVRFPGPNSYTGEDCAELHCHGSPVVLNAGLASLFAAGCRQAKGGEFTRRAFLNGRMDLIQAESVADLIDAETAEAAKNAACQLDGALSRAIGRIYNALMDMAARFYAVVDYPDEDIDPFELSQLESALQASSRTLSALLSSCHRGRMVRSGVRITILGSPNAGKSSLLNALSGFDRVIVTDIPGTTRDTVEQTVTLGRHLVRLVDTAGIRDTQDVIEKIGVDRSMEAAKDCDVALYVLDDSKPMTEEDRRAMGAALEAPEAVAILNKQDLAAVIEPSDLPFAYIVPISCKDGTGFDLLEQAFDMLFPDDTPCDGSLLTNARQAGAILRAKKSVDSAVQSLRAGMTPDAVLVDLEAAMDALGEVTGRTMREDITNRIFERFCVGK